MSSALIGISNLSADILAREREKTMVQPKKLSVHLRWNVGDELH